MTKLANNNCALETISFLIKHEKLHLRTTAGAIFLITCQVLMPITAKSLFHQKNSNHMTDYDLILKEQGLILLHRNLMKHAFKIKK